MILYIKYISDIFVIYINIIDDKIFTLNIRYLYPIDIDDLHISLS